MRSNACAGRVSEWRMIAKRPFIEKVIIPERCPSIARCARLTFAMDLLFDVLAFPFRLIGRIVNLLGRTVVVLLGFVIMVLGVALALPPFFFSRALGIPLFIVGLLLVLRGLA